MRLPYASTTPPTDDASAAAIYERIASRRAPRALQPLDLTLLLSPEIADGWNHFLGAVRTKTTLDPGLSELAICRIAVLNEAGYEWTAHAPLARKGGISEEVLEAVVELGKGPKGEKPAVMSEREWAVIRYADTMTLEVRVGDELWGELGKWFGDRERMEITSVIAAYNMVSRFLVALDVGEKNGTDIKTIAAQTK